MGLVKWRAQVNVKDDDLSLINICLHCHFYLLKDTPELLVKTVAMILALITKLKKAKIKGSDEISLDV